LFGANIGITGRSMRMVFLVTAAGTVGVLCQGATRRAMHVLSKDTAGRIVGVFRLGAYQARLCMNVLGTGANIVITCIRMGMTDRDRTGTSGPEGDLIIIASVIDIDYGGAVAGYNHVFVC